MTLHALTPMLRTWDFPRALAFYTQILGFHCDSGGAEAGWASLSRDGVTLMLAAPNAHEGHTAPKFSGSLYLRTDDIEGWWARLKDRAPVCYPLQEFDYGMREFAVYDSDGYLLQFGQAVCG